jgi:hypothetical protein
LERFGPEFEVPDMLPLSNGGVLLEWESDDYEVAIQISSPFQVSLLVETCDADVEVDATHLLPSKLLTEYHWKLVDRIPRRDPAVA